MMANVLSTDGDFEKYNKSNRISIVVSTLAPNHMSYGGDLSYAK